MKPFIPLLKETIVSVFRFYWDGFRSMTLGKTLWLIILIKLFIVFVILRLFFFPDFLSDKGDTDSKKSDYVGNELVSRGMTGEMEIEEDAEQ